MLMAVKKGRPRQDGARYPSGKLRPGGEGKPPAQWGRIVRLREDIDQIRLGEDVALDARIGTELHRLKFFGRLTEVEWATGCLVAEIYGAYDRYVSGQRRSVASPSYMRGFGSGDGLDERYMTDDAIRRLRRREAGAKKRWERLQALLDYDRRAIVERVCVDNASVSPVQVDQLAAVLREIGTKLGVYDVAQQPGGGPPKKPIPVKAAGRRPGSSKSFVKVLGKLRPDLTPEQIEEACRIEQALDARHKFRRSKERPKR